MSDTLAMIRICASDDVSEDSILKVEIDGHAPVSVARANGQVFVFPDQCPHAEESLSEGWIEDGRVICGVHFAEFELGSGEVHNRPVGCPNMKFYPSEERDGSIFASLD